MAKKTCITKSIRKNIQKFGEVIKKQGIPVSKLIVFGSYARNNPRVDSDIDLCIVSPSFGKDITDELQFLFKQSRHIDTRLEPYPVSSKDYKDMATPLIQEIKKYGKEIFV